MSEVGKFLDAAMSQPAMVREVCPIHGGVGGLLGYCDCGCAETDEELRQRACLKGETTPSRLRRVLGAEIARLRGLMFVAGHCIGDRTDVDVGICGNCPWLDDNHCTIDGWEPPGES